MLFRRHKKQPKPRILLRLALFLVLVSVALVLPLRWFNPPLTAFVAQDQVSYSLRAAWVSYDQLSKPLTLAVITAEDQKFPDHFGFDFAALKSALLEQRARKRGGSTITQQLAKNLYLWPGRSLLRKGLEAWLTLWLELLLPKQRLIELYLNVVEFGPGIYGVGKAAKHFYNISAGVLSPYQASLLAAVLPNPKRFSASRPSAYIRQRAADIRAGMRALGGLGFLDRLVAVQ